MDALHEVPDDGAAVGERADPRRPLPVGAAGVVAGGVVDEALRLEGPGDAVDHDRPVDADGQLAGPDVLGAVRATASHPGQPGLGWPAWANMIGDLPPKFVSQLMEAASRPCCKRPLNHDIEAFYSSEKDRDRGIPDIYVMHCRCGRKHRRFMVGGSIGSGVVDTMPRPFWEVA